MTDAAHAENVRPIQVLVRSRLVNLAVAGVVLAALLAGAASYFALSYYPQLRLERLLSSVTDQYVRDHVRPMTDEVADRTHAGLPFDPAILKARRITTVEVGTPDPDGPYPTTITNVVYRDETLGYDRRGFTTGLPNATRTGLVIPQDLDSPHLELRINYDYGSHGHVAVHIVVDRPNHRMERTRATPSKGEGRETE